MTATRPAPRRIWQVGSRPLGAWGRTLLRWTSTLPPARQHPALRCFAAKAKPRQKDEGVYSKTVNLPVTSFDMRANSVVREPQLQAFWEEHRIYERLSRENPGDVFTLHDGPPYANGDLHVGHALNKILKDIINRYQLLRGRKAIYIPGWDTHGLPIELKALQSLPPDELASLDPLRLRARCRQFALKTIDVQRSGFRRFGVWGDWDAPYLTLDPAYEAAQLRVFGRMVLAGHIYRGLKPVHWSPSTQTALAEAELEYPEGHVSPSIYVALRVQELGDAVPAEAREYLQGAELAVWTTTPWTLPANRAVAVHPALEYAVVDMPTGRRLVVAAGRVESLAAKLGPGTAASASASASAADNPVPQLKVLCTVPGSALIGCRYASPLEESMGKPSTAPITRPVLDGREFVTADSGTGLVHMAPGHGHEDFAVASRHGIAVCSPVDASGRFTAEAGPEFEGLEVLGAGNEAVTAALEQNQRLLARERYPHKYPYDWRSKRPVIIRATAQWFASVDGLREAALGALGDVTFVPGAGRTRISSMVVGRNDWCVSRQRSWGVPIPAFYDSNTGEPLMDAETLEHVAAIAEREGSDAWWRRSVAELLPESRRHLADGLVKGTDTMDVWFDSGSSWASVLDHGSDDGARVAAGVVSDCPRADDLNATPPSSPKPRFPADLYLEGSDQHRGWFQSSLLTAVAVRGCAPYRTVLTHGFTLDEAGQKMSKSLGNVMDPREVIAGGRDAKTQPAYGADVLRLWAASVDYTGDQSCGPNILAGVADVYRKLRVTLRFMLGNLHGFDPERDAIKSPQNLALADRHILNRMASLEAECREAYEGYQFFRVYQALQRFCVADLSNFYLDACKDRLYVLAEQSPERRAAQTTLASLLLTMLPLLAPLAPHLAEDAWQALPWSAPHLSVFQAGWPAAVEATADGVAANTHTAALSEEEQAAMQALLAIRAETNALMERARAARLIKSSLEAAVEVETSDPGMRAVLQRLQAADNGQDTVQNTCIVSQAAIVDELSEDDPHDDDNRESSTIMSPDKIPLVAGDESRGTLRVALRRAKGCKCARCWNYSEAVGSDAAHPMLCQRCVPVVKAMPGYEAGPPPFPGGEKQTAGAA